MPKKRTKPEETIAEFVAPDADLTPVAKIEVSTPALPDTPEYSVCDQLIDIMWVYKRERNRLSRPAQQRLYKLWQHLREHCKKDLL